jgi:hypothetical protein
LKGSSHAAPNYSITASASHWRSFDGSGGYRFWRRNRAGCSQAAPVSLGTASKFVVLGGSAVTNTGSSVLNGWLGVSPGSAISGFPPGVVNGATHATDAVASKAQADVTTAYNTAAASLPSTDLTGQNLGGLTLTPGT